MAFAALPMLPPPDTRWGVLLTVEITMDSPSQFFTDLGLGVTSGGVLVATFARLPLHEEMFLQLVLPAGRFRGAGVALWRRDAMSDLPPVYGVCFLELPRESRAAIEAFCRRRPPLYYDASLQRDAR